MAPAILPVRGTHDILPDGMHRFRHVEETALNIARRYGYDEIAVPIFEFTEVFSRTLGDTSDIVTKEMYTFQDKGGDSITLRPEGTAGVARAFISNGMAQNLPLRFCYRGPMFRYERPQKGRQRQFHQVGIELLGVPDPLGDAEVICLGADFLRALGVEEKVALELNSLGDVESRSIYREKLVAYFKSHQGRLSEDSLRRLERNPLRILDSKDAGDRSVVADAPVLGDSLNAESKTFFDTVRTALDAAGIRFRVNPRLVRGLDYYGHTAFEFVTEALGAQGAVLAGGRYDGLIKQMGGPATPGTGWAAGIERLSMLVAEPAPSPNPIAIVSIGGPDVSIAAFALARQLRCSGFAVDMAYSGNVGRRMKRADRVGARAAVIMGEDELSRSAVTVRDMRDGGQEEVALASLETYLARFS
jgi:histidyl-tRNA synthetase